MVRTLSCLIWRLRYSLFRRSRPRARRSVRRLVVGLLPGRVAPTVMRLNEPLRAYLKNGLPAGRTGRRR